MRTLIRSVSMASSGVLERPEKILLIQGVEVPVDGGRERTNLPGPNVPGCTQTQQLGRLGRMSKS